MIRIKRIYEPASPDDGRRYLVDRLWPRGMKKEAAHIDGWLKEVAPSNALRNWYGHDPEKWEEFCRQYFAELDSQPETWQPLLDAAQEGVISLLFSTREIEHNNATALKLYLEKRLEVGGKHGAS